VTRGFADIGLVHAGTRWRKHGESSRSGARSPSCVWPCALADTLCAVRGRENSHKCCAALKLRHATVTLGSAAAARRRKGNTLLADNKARPNPFANLVDEIGRAVQAGWAQTARMTVLLAVAAAAVTLVLMNSR
jgi:hypothetical protein